MATERAREILRDYLDPDVEFQAETLDAVIAAIVAAELRATPEATRMADGIAREWREHIAGHALEDNWLRSNIAAAITRAVEAANDERVKKWATTVAQNSEQIAKLESELAGMKDERDGKEAK